MDTKKIKRENAVPSKSRIIEMQTLMLSVLFTSCECPLSFFHLNIVL